MPSKKIIKSIIDLKKKEKETEEVEQYLLKYARKEKISGVDITTKEFKDKIEEMRNKMLGGKQQKQSQGGGGLRGMLEDLDNLGNLKDDIINSLTELEAMKLNLENELRGVKIKVNEIQNKSIDWEEIQNKPEVILQDEFYQEQLKTEESQKRSFSLFQLLKDELENIREYFGQLIKGISSEINQLRNRKTNHSELIGITKDQHHKEQHTLENHLTSKLMEELKRLVSGEFTDDLHQHRILRQDVGKSFESFGMTRNDLAYYLIDNETPTGNINSSNTDFVLANTPESGSVKVFVNGQRMAETEDYTISNATITFLTAPPTGSILLVDYFKQ